MAAYLASRCVPLIADDIFYGVLKHSHGSQGSLTQLQKMVSMRVSLFPRVRYFFWANLLLIVVLSMSGATVIGNTWSANQTLAVTWT